MFTHSSTYLLHVYTHRFEHFKFVHAGFFLPPNHLSFPASTSFFLHFLLLPSFCIPPPSLSPFFSPLPFPRYLSPSLFCFFPTLHASLSPSLCLSRSLSLRTSKGCVSTKAQLNSGVVDLGRSLTTQEKGRESDSQKEKETRKKRKRRRESTGILTKLKTGICEAHMQGVLFTVN